MGFRDTIVRTDSEMLHPVALPARNVFRRSLIVPTALRRCLHRWSNNSDGYHRALRSTLAPALSSSNFDSTTMMMSGTGWNTYIRHAAQYVNVAASPDDFHQRRALKKYRQRYTRTLKYFLQGKGITCPTESDTLLFQIQYEATYGKAPWTMAPGSSRFAPRLVHWSEYLDRERDYIDKASKEAGDNSKCFLQQCKVEFAQLFEWEQAEELRRCQKGLDALLLRMGQNMQKYI
ncbi:hypothetical protein C8J56DRAFT_1065729 [Mycena floridula]|nr:hypothetical protein C8J56DRAFT_1065729 [Mycena floridula]